jgi:hypothetical protein
VIGMIIHFGKHSGSRSPRYLLIIYLKDPNGTGSGSKALYPAPGA